MTSLVDAQKMQTKDGKMLKNYKENLSECYIRSFDYIRVENLKLVKSQLIFLNS